MNYPIPTVLAEYLHGELFATTTATPAGVVPVSGWWVMIRWRLWGWGCACPVGLMTRRGCGSCCVGVGRGHAVPHGSWVDLDAPDPEAVGKCYTRRGFRDQRPRHP